MNKKVSMNELSPLIFEMLSSGGEVTFTVTGISMLPLLHEGIDTVTLSSAKSKLKKYDLPLYKRKNGAFVLHRVVKVTKDDGYIMCGDNQFYPEYGITDKQIIGIVKRIGKPNKTIYVNTFRYKLYCRFWVNTRFIRRVCASIKNRGKRLLKLG
ncbi:MAG: S24/S26 family peptidase [Bacillota bacterium]|nr:S24/S26 family peptidase [Bacillota bacterium]